MILKLEGNEMLVCAWCEFELSTLPSTVGGIDATNYGMCAGCVSERLVALVATPPGTLHKLLHPLGPAGLAAPQKRAAV
jgi:hypothetical protein